MKLPAMLAALGWLVSAALVALLASDLLGRVERIRADGRSDGPTSVMVMSAALFIAAEIVTAIGWVWWSVVALLNARRLIPLRASPLWPVAVYGGGPLLLVWSEGSTGGARDVVTLAGLLLIFAGHIGVLTSLRDSATRLGARPVQFSRLIWVPILVGVARVGVMLFVVDEVAPERQVLLCLATYSLSGLMMAYLVHDATSSFEHACRNTLLRRAAPADPGLPPPAVVAAALRQSWQPEPQGRRSRGR